MSKAEANLTYTAHGTYARRPAPTPDEIEKALSNMAPNLSTVRGTPAADTGGLLLGHDSTPKKAEVTPQVDNWEWTKAALDIAGGTTVMTGLLFFGVVVYCTSRYALPKLFAWLSAL